MIEAFVYEAIRTPRGKGKKDGALAAGRFDRSVVAVKDRMGLTMVGRV